MPRMHCHVYLIEKMVHLSVEADTMEYARQLALTRSKQFTPTPADCSRICLCFPIAADNDARLLRDTEPSTPLEKP
jgi:hypothetical protein